MAISGGLSRSTIPRKGKIKMETKLYIAYGSNMNLPQMAKRCPTAKVVGTSVLHSWRLLFRGGHGNAVATVERHKGGQVPVLVWEITPSDEEALDRYEGFPFLYRKEIINIKMDGKPTKVMAYIMNTNDSRFGYRPLNQPSAFYYSVIREGYKDAGFNVDVLRRAAKRSIEPDKPNTNLV